jgi:hypothetical protein
MNSARRNRFFSVLNIGLLILSLVIGLVPLILFIRLEGKEVWPEWPIIFTSAGGITLLIHLVRMFIRHCREEPGNFENFFRAIWSRLAESFSPFVIGACIGAIGTGIHLFYSEGGPAHERYDTAIGIYLSAITASLGIRAFYDRLIPITSVNTLLRRLTADLKRCKEGTIWIAYPALNIGFFRNSVAGSTAIVKDFSRALQECAARLKGANAVTYDEPHIKKLYQTYASAQGRQELAVQCSNNAIQMSKDLVRAIGETTQEDTDSYLASHIKEHIHELSPESFPQHVVVIGPITYILVSYGLPIYRPARNGKEDAFEVISGEHKLVDIVAYRREDSALAHMISSALDQLVKPAK